MGPTCSGINVRNFVIMHRDTENAMGQLNSSAQFGKMSVDFYYEEIDKGAKDTSNNFSKVKGTSYLNE